MPFVRLSIRKSDLDAELENFIGRSQEVKSATFNYFYGIFLNAKRAMMEEFDRHPVTVELNEGPDAPNYSGTLGGYGNLFAFLGFYAHEKPTEELRILLSDISARQTVYRNRKWYFRVELPSQEEIESRTQMTWESGNSWALQIEKANGISGLSNFLFAKWDQTVSRSGMGIQLTDQTINEENFTPIKYLSQILSNFRERLNSF